MIREHFAAAATAGASTVRAAIAAAATVRAAIATAATARAATAATAAIAAAAIAIAPVAAADGGDNMYFDQPGHYATDVPGMNYDAHLNAPCDNMDFFTFGRGPGGEALQCRWIANQWPPIDTGFWVSTYELFGVQNIGAPCPKPQAAAQSPDGRPLLCLGEQGWQPGFFTRDGFFPG